MIVEELCLHYTGCIRGHIYRRFIQPRQHVLGTNSCCSCQKAYLPLWLLKGPPSRGMQGNPRANLLDLSGSHQRRWMTGFDFAIVPEAEICLFVKERQRDRNGR